MKRTAHFLLVPELAGSPPNDAILSALAETGYQTDIYAPSGAYKNGNLVHQATLNHVEYGFRWILKNIFSPKWRKYDLFSGTSEDPMAVVGLLSTIYNRPSFTLADEIRSGSYSGNRPKWWKALCRHGMRNSKFTIVNDTSRITLQRKYANLSTDHHIITYPGCFINPPPLKDRAQIRKDLHIPLDALVLGYSGVYNLGNGGLWLAKVLAKNSEIYIYGQLIGVDSLTQGLLKRLRGNERLILENERLSWRESWSSMSVVDIGMVVYLQDGPQFQNMGTSSNRLCMFIAMGVPVIANYQNSFEFIEHYRCGVLVKNVNEFIDAIGYVRDNLPKMKFNAGRCAKEYLNSSHRYRTIVDYLNKIKP